MQIRLTIDKQGIVRQKWKTSQKMGLESEGRSDPAIWMTAEGDAFKEVGSCRCCCTRNYTCFCLIRTQGVPVFDVNADFSGSPDIGGFDEKWFIGGKEPGDGKATREKPKQKTPCAGVVAWIAKHSNFSMSSPWHGVLGNAGQSSADEMKEYIAGIPTTQKGPYCR